jgi:hypothetical protein
MVVKRHGRRRQRSAGGEFVVRRSRWYLPSVAVFFVKIQNSRGTSLAVGVHLGTSLRYVHQVPKCHKVVHLGLDHI